MNKFIAFNPSYILKPDSGRALIMSAIIGRDSYQYMQDSTSTFIHPIFAIILSFCDGRSISCCVEDISRYLSIGKDIISTFLIKLTDNPNFVSVKSKQGYSFFPPFSLISLDKETNAHRFEPGWFLYSKVDLRFKRHSTPSTITLMVNNICFTDCIYCYEDKTRRWDCKIPFSRIKELIHEARKIHVRTFDVIGGEFFLYKNWREVLYELRKYDYDPYLSTKLPIGEGVVRTLSDFKVRDIQVSLDSLIEAHLSSSIKVRKGYVNKMVHTLWLLNKYHIKTMVHTVLTKYNNSNEDMMSIFEVIKQMDNICEWKIVKAEDSIYARTAYDNFKIDETSLKELGNYLNSIKGRSPFKVVVPWIREGSGSGQNMSISFFDRNYCSGNYSSIYILPNGDVTICEQLYWNKNFILGNIVKNSILDIWNSERAVSLFNIKQRDIPRDSLCSTCQDYNRCRSLKQVCYRDVVRKYGSDKWYYPDVNCPYSKL